MKKGEEVLVEKFTFSGHTIISVAASLIFVYLNEQKSGNKISEEEVLREFTERPEEVLKLFERTENDFKDSVENLKGIIESNKNKKDETGN